MNRNRFRAAVGAAAVITTLFASGAGISPAVAATTGDHGAQAGQHAGKAGKGKDGQNGARGDVGKLARAVDKVDARFERLLSRAADKLSEADSARVAAAIAADRALLAQLTTVAEVRDLRPENYEQVIAWLRKLERLVATVDTATVDPAITEAATAVAEQLFAVTAASDKADLRAAKHELNTLEALIEAALAEGTTDPVAEDGDVTA